MENLIVGSMTIYWLLLNKYTKITFQYINKLVHTIFTGLLRDHHDILLGIFYLLNFLIFAANTLVKTGLNYLQKLFCKVQEKDSANHCEEGQ